MDRQDEWEVIATTCEDGNCPKMLRHRTSGDVRVRGYLPDGTETDVTIPAADWSLLRTQLP